MTLDDALRTRLLAARERLNEADMRVISGELASCDEERWTAISEWDNAKHAVIMAVLAAA